MQGVSSRRQSLLLICGFAAVVLAFEAGCGGDEPEEKESAEHPELPCVQQDYPCTFAGVDDEVNERTLALINKVMFRAKGGDEWKSTLEWLRDQPSVAEAIGSSNAIRFRLEGGRPASVFLEPFNRPDGEPDETSDTTTRKSPLVAGGDRDPREPKDGLVLSADHEIAPEVTSDVRGILRGTRGYEGVGGVEYRTSDQGLELADFQDWDQFDFVYFLAHGGCIDDACRQTTISTGIELGVSAEYPYERTKIVSSEDGSGTCREEVELTESQQEEIDEFDDVKENILEESQYADEPGVAVGARPGSCSSETNRVSGEQYNLTRCKNILTLGLDAPFFRAHSDDFENTLVISNSCRLFANEASDLAELFSGEEGAFFGWSETVLGPDTQVIPQLVRLLSDRGSPGWTAMKALAAELSQEGEQEPGNDGRVTGGEQPTDKCGEEPIVPVLRHSEQRDTIRIREIVTVFGPFGAPLRDGQPMGSMVEGIAGDGQNDSLEVQVLVEGIDEQRETVSSNPDDYDLRFEWNGEPIGETYNVGELGEPSSETDYGYRVVLEEVPLDRDVEPQRTHTLAAIVELPEGGTSKMEAEDLIVSPCYGRYEAGPLGWNSEEARATEPFGWILESSPGVTTVQIDPRAGDVNDARHAAANIRESIDGTGTYPASLIVNTEDAMYWTAQMPTGEVEIEEIREGETTDVVRGTFRGDVVGPTGQEEQMTYTLTAAFSLPLAGDLYDPSRSVGVWEEACGIGFSPP